ncbi:hypothetical protein [Microcoleus sp. AT9b-C3]|uniref:hypothetical protein n=1 Tax=Microcoleus sp. AT9b-C3 TaxID=2818629 RepID=UPI002FD22A06
MFNLFNWLGLPTRQKTYRLRITDSQGNQTYTRVAADSGFDALDKVAAQLPRLQPGETRSIKCFDCIPTRRMD